MSYSALLLVLFILQNLLHAQCSSFPLANCVANTTDHRNCLITEINTCGTACENPNLYEATGDNRKCIVKGCASYNVSTCHLNDACVLTEETPSKCASTCVDHKVFLPIEGKCVRSDCQIRKPKSMSVSIKVTHVNFSYGNKYSNNVGVTVMGIQQNTSLYNTRNATGTSFDYNNETALIWDNVKEENLESVRIQVYTEQKFFIGQANISISEYKTLDGAVTAINVSTGNVTEPDQTQNVTLEVGVCTSCGSASWPCGTAIEDVLCYQNFDDCVVTCESTDGGHYDPDTKTGICVQACEERTNSGEEKWPCGNNFETTPCYANPNTSVTGLPECTANCTTQTQWFTPTIDGVCVFRPCDERQPNLSSALFPFPCGGVDCFYDPTPQEGGGEGLCLESCPNNDGVDGVCGGGIVIVPCSDRVPDLSFAGQFPFPCGGDCYYDPHAQTPGGLCVEACPNSDDANGVCGDTDCESRIPNVSAQLPCGPGDCFYDAGALLPNGGYGAKKCTTTCTVDDIHMGGAENGTCKIVSCVNRYPDFSDIYICKSSDCFYDSEAPEGRKCVFQCPVNNVHTGIETEAGACELFTCSLRQPNQTMQYPCGVKDCFYDAAAPAGKQCVSACGHSQNAVDGKCTLVPCINRNVNHTEVFPCGSTDCFLDAATGHCLSVCPPADTVHTGGTTTDGKCALTPCNTRTVWINDSATLASAYPCGSNECILNPVQTAASSSGELQCVSECPNNDAHLDGDVAGGMCTLKPCSERTGDLSTTVYPCGSSDCYYDPDGVAQGTDIPECTEACFGGEVQYTVKDSVCVSNEEPTNRGFDNNNNNKNNKKKLSAGAVVGIVVGAVVLLAIVGVVVGLILYNKKKKKGYENLDDDDDSEPEDAGKGGVN